MSAVGTTKVLTFRITDEVGVLYDPGSVFLISGPVDGPTTTKKYLVSPDVTRTSAGVYRCEVECTTAGEWGARLEARKLDEVTVEGAFEKYWAITPTRIPAPIP